MSRETEADIAADHLLRHLEASGYPRGSAQQRRMGTLRVRLELMGERFDGRAGCP
jgi:hypothetical protein